MNATARPPRGLGQPGRDLWHGLVDEYELEPHERTVLLQACRTADTVAQLQAVLDAEGVTREGRPHPILAELRQQRIALARMLAALRIPTADDERGQQRSGFRGVYGVESAS